MEAEHRFSLGTSPELHVIRPKKKKKMVWLSGQRAFQIKIQPAHQIFSTYTTLWPDGPSMAAWFFGQKHATWLFPLSIGVMFAKK